MLKKGDTAPDFTALTGTGEKISLSSYRGKKVVLYFYPKDNTSGCTAEACDLRDNYDRLLSQGYSVIGVSKDSETSHRNFTQKYSLPFPLVADTDTSILQMYDAWGEKSMYGKKYMGAIRKTYLIDENGVITDIIEKVDTKAHTAQILK
ncbi:MAG: thioredoxin-dependent thiol peroxidase [Flavobacteriales bacterium]|nr:thioredoxin-dependent thiol peroxidase [Flavobacteriales bacterium]